MDENAHLASFGRKAEALRLFAELIALSKNRIGQSAVDKYSKNLADLLFVVENYSFPEEVKRFKRETISRSLKNNDASVVDAARDLQISHQRLSEILHNQFPDLREIFKLTDRASRRIKPALKKQSVKKNGTVPVSNKIKQFDLSIFEVRFDEPQFDDEDEIFGFFAPGEEMAQLKICGGAVIAVLRENFHPNAPFLIFVRETGDYKVCTAGFDKLSNFYYLTDNTDMPMPLDSKEFIVVGRIIGFCLEKDIRADEITFKTLRL